MSRKLLLYMALAFAGLMTFPAGKAPAPAEVEAESAKPEEKKAWKNGLAAGQSTREQIEKKRKEIEARIKERARTRWEKRLDKIRKTLNVSSDEQWGRLQGKIGMLEALRQARALCIDGGSVVMRLAKFGMGPDQASYPRPFYSLLCPAMHTEAEEVKSVLESQEKLAALLAQADASDEAIAEGLSAYRKAKKDLEAQVQNLQAELRDELTPRQEAALVLLGLLD